MRRLLFLIALLPCASWAQLQLFQFDGAKETAVGLLTDLGTVSNGDNADVRFRVHNMSTRAVTIDKIAVSGSAFTIAAAPDLGYVLAPSAFAEVRVGFRPPNPGSYTGTFTVNGLVVALRASAVPAADVLLDGSVLGSGAAVDFGKAQLGSRVARSFALRNSGTASLAIASLAVSGAGFRLGSGSAPLSLAPGQTASFQVVFEPGTPQSLSGSLTIDKRTIALTGTGLNYPLPSASIRLDSGAAASGTQNKLVVALSEASRVSATGTVTLQFQPKGSAADDPALQFLAGPPRTASFTISPGDSAVRFYGKADISFQTGTTAGTMVFTLQLDGNQQQTSVEIAGAPVTLDSATGSRRANDLDVNLIGWDNTHSTSSLNFTFYDVAGAMVGGRAIPVDVTASFRRYFDGSAAGGTFAVRATFPVTGDATKIGGVEVEVVNAAGSTKTQRISF